MINQPRQRFAVAAVASAAALFGLGSIRTSHGIVTAFYLVLCVSFIVLPFLTLKARALAYTHRHLIGGLIVGWLAFIGRNVLSVLTSPSSSDVIGLFLGALVGSAASIVALRVIRQGPVVLTS